MQASVFKKTAENLVLFTVDKLDGCEPSGRLYHYYQTEPIAYTGMGRMIKEVDQFYNWLGFPAASTNERSFWQEKGGPPAQRQPKRVMVADRDEMLAQNGELATFFLYVQHRENSTWQGELYWKEKEKALHFTSELELIKLIDSAIHVLQPNEAVSR